MQATPLGGCRKNVIKQDTEFIAAVHNAIENVHTRRNSELMAYNDIDNSITNNRYLTLKRINEKAGVNGLAEAFVIAYLHDMADYLQFSEPITEEQYAYTGRMVVSKYGYLKAREILIFFAQVKSGKYGKFYGKFDPLLFNDFLQSFVRWRNERIDYISQQERQKRWEEEKKQCIDIDTFLSRHSGERFDNLRKIYMRQHEY